MKLNNYLLLIGNQMAEIRQILGITQEELAKMMGVSRPTIVKIEQDPTKMTKALGYAFFSSVSYEILKRLKETEYINPDEYEREKDMGIFLKNIASSSGTTISGLKRVTTMALSKLIPNIGTIWTSLPKGNIAEGATAILKKYGGEIKWDLDKAKLIKDTAEKKLQDDHKRMLAIFNLNELSVLEFGEEIEKGEDPDYDMW